jgi:hypothetical protein
VEQAKVRIDMYFLLFFTLIFSLSPLYEKQRGVDPLLAFSLLPFLEPPFPFTARRKEKY